jgi:hypothetical protein
MSTKKQVSRLGDIISQVRQPSRDELVERDPALEEQPALPPAPTKRATRPLAKSKNPEYKPTTLYVRRQTFNAAQGKLIGADMDLSDVVDALLAKWNAGGIDV